MKRFNNLPNRLLLIVLAVFIIQGCAKQKAAKLGISAPVYKVKVDLNVMIPMSDGVEMATDIYYPVGIEKAPAILVRTPYGKNNMRRRDKNKVPRRFAERGFVYIVQDVRGRYSSEGEFYPFTSDGQDGKEMIAWIRSQSWSNGKIGTYGASYLGTTQWFSSDGDQMDAMHLTVTSPDLTNVIYNGGELHLMTAYFWAVAMGDHKANKMAALKMATNLDKYISTLPLDMADDATGKDVPYFNQTTNPIELMEIYDTMSFEEKYKEVKAPAVFVAGMV